MLLLVYTKASTLCAATISNKKRTRTSRTHRITAQHVSSSILLSALLFLWFRRHYSRCALRIFETPRAHELEMALLTLSRPSISSSTSGARRRGHGFGTTTRTHAILAPGRRHGGSGSRSESGRGWTTSREGLGAVAGAVAGAGAPRPLRCSISECSASAKGGYVRRHVRVVTAHASDAGNAKEGAGESSSGAGPPEENATVVVLQSVGRTFSSYGYFSFWCVMPR